MSRQLIHPIQWKLLNVIADLAQARFNEIKNLLHEQYNLELDPKQFAYHLRKLQDTNLVEVAQSQGIKQYKLTDEGKYFHATGRRSGIDGNMPAYTSFMLYIRKDDKLLMVTRQAKPFKNFTGLPYFLPRADQFLEDTAMETFQQLGFSGKLSPALVTETISRTDSNTVLRHVFSFIFYASNPDGTLTVDHTHEGKLQWIALDEIKNLPHIYDDEIAIREYFESTNFRKATQTNRPIKIIQHVDSLYDKM